MKIDLTEDQYLKLIKLTFIGELIVNGTKIKPEEMDLELRELSSYIYSHAKDFNCSKYVKEFYDDFEIIQPYDEYIHEYIEDGFWEQFLDRLSVSVK